MRPSLLFLTALAVAGCANGKLFGDKGDVTNSGPGGGPGGGSGGGLPTLVPELIVSEPARGLMTTDASGVVVGQIRNPDPELSYVAMVNGTVVDLDGRLQFAHEVPFESGTAIIQTIAADSLDSRAADHRAVLSGTFSTPYAPQEDGFVFQVPSGALSEMGSRADEYFDPETLESFIVNPVMSEEVEFCMGFCWTMWGIELNAWNPDFSHIEALVRPWDGGVDVQFVMYDFTMDWAGTGVVSEIGYTGYGNMSSDAMVVTMSVAMSWEDDGLQTDVVGVHVDSNGFDISFDNFFYELFEYFGMDPDFMVVGLMESTFESMMAARLPGVMDDLLEDMSFAREIRSAGQDYTFSGDITNVSATRDGLWVHYQTGFTAPVRRHSDTLGHLTREQTIPAPVATEEYVVGAIGLNLLNQMFFALWDGGALDMEVPVEALGLSADDFAAMMPGITEVVVHTRPLLPPTVRPSLTGAGVATVTMGDVMLELYDPNLSMDAPFMTVALSLRADLSFRTNAAGNGVNPVLSGVEVYPTVVRPDSGLTTELLAGLDAMLLPVATESLPAILGSMVTLPLDLIDGFRFRNVTFGPHTGDGTYLKMEAILDVD